MTSTVLVGLQWGDEGKGKIIDVLTKKAEVVARFQGGNNAGHTVYVGEEKYVLHLVPSGIIRDGALCVIGNGLVVNPLALCEEIAGLEDRGIDVEKRLRISNRCQLLFQYHCELDGLSEKNLGDHKIGTTKRGIGPAYADKVNRVGIRAIDLCYPERLEERFRTQAAATNTILSSADCETIDIDAEWEKVKAAADKLAPMVDDTSLLMNKAIDSGKEVLFEGAQGMLLDVDFGTYPFVTSSNTTVGGACTGTGVPPTKIQHCLGVVKAYTTRVGEGPFPTELFDETGEFIRAKGHEFGATTGRPRRTGWLDAVAARYSVMVNGADQLAITKLDVLDELETIQVCTAYELDGERIETLPSDNDEMARCKPIYEESEGWNEPTVDCKCWDDLPEKCKSYLNWIAGLMKSNIEIISVGPRRDQTFFRNA